MNLSNLSGLTAKSFAPLLIWLLTVLIGQSAQTRELDLSCEEELRTSRSQEFHTARVQFDDAKARTGAPTAIKVDWVQPGRTGSFGGLASERKVRWSGLLIRSIEFSVSAKLSFELLFSPTDDIYVVRKKTNGQSVAELPCRIEF